MIPSSTEEIVHRMYIENNIITLDCLNITNIAEIFDLDLHYMDFPSQSYESGTYRAIILNKDLPIELQRFDFFHELAHFIIHDSDQKKVRHSFSDYMEWQADQFAIHAAIPIHVLQRFTPLTTEKIARLFLVPNCAAQRKIEQIQSCMLTKGCSIG